MEEVYTQSSKKFENVEFEKIKMTINYNIFLLPLVKIHKEQPLA